MCGSLGLTWRCRTRCEVSKERQTPRSRRTLRHGEIPRCMALRMQDVKMTVQVARRENVGHETDIYIFYMLCYISDIMFKSLLCTNCFVELSFAFVVMS